MRLEYDFRGSYTVLESDGIYGSYSVLMTLRPSRQLIRLDDLDKLCHQGIWGRNVLGWRAIICD
jgi:hypothetical protein